MWQILQVVDSKDLKIYARQAPRGFCGDPSGQRGMNETTAASSAGFYPRRRAWPRCACANNAPISWPASIRRSRSERSPESLLLPFPKSLCGEDRGNAFDAGNLATGAPRVLGRSHRVGWIKVPDRYRTLEMTLFPIEAVTHGGEDGMLRRPVRETHCSLLYDGAVANFPRAWRNGRRSGLKQLECPSGNRRCRTAQSRGNLKWQSRAKPGSASGKV